MKISEYRKIKNSIRKIDLNSLIFPKIASNRFIDFVEDIEESKHSNCLLVSKYLCVFGDVVIEHRTVFAFAKFKVNKLPVQKLIYSEKFDFIRINKKYIDIEGYFDVISKTSIARYYHNGVICYPIAHINRDDEYRKYILREYIYRENGKHVRQMLLNHFPQLEECMR